VLPEELTPSRLWNMRKEGTVLVRFFGTYD